MRTKAGYLFMSTKTSYQKPALNLDEQIAYLQSLGLIISNQKLTHKRLSIVSLHRLANYFHTFVQEHSQGSIYFKSGTTFEAIWQLYVFDRQLRLLVTAAIERIEVAFRALLINTISVRHGSHWYTKVELFKDPKRHMEFMALVAKLCKNSKEPVITNYCHRYNHPTFPPAWAIIEEITLGACSKLFQNLRHLSDKKAITTIFGYHPTLIDSWMCALTYSRNLCAHHARLWDRWFVYKPKDLPIFNPVFKQGRPFYQYAVLFQRLLTKIAPHYKWKQKLFKLFLRFPEIPIDKMGFLPDWQQDPFWENVTSEQKCRE